MAAYLWDSQAALAIEEQELDTHYAEHREHYRALTKNTWERLAEINERPSYLKHDDLFDALLPLIYRDSITQEGMRERDLPLPLARGAARWYEWFTHFLTEQYLKEMAS